MPEDPAIERLRQARGWLAHQDQPNRLNEGARQHVRTILDALDQPVYARTRLDALRQLRREGYAVVHADRLQAHTPEPGEVVIDGERFELRRLPGLYERQGGFGSLELVSADDPDAEPMALYRLVPLPAPSTPEAERCHSGTDGDCSWPACPQEANNRANYQSWCPLATREAESDD